MFNTLPTSSDDLKGKSWDAIQPYFDELEARDLTAETLDLWLRDYSRLDDLLSEYGARRQVAASQDTSDAEAERLLSDYFEQIMPGWDAASQRMREKLLASKLEPSVSRHRAAQSALGSRLVPRGESAADDGRRTAQNSLQQDHGRANGDVGRRGKDAAPDGNLAARRRPRRARTGVESGLAAAACRPRRAQCSVGGTLDGCGGRSRRTRARRIIWNMRGRIGSASTTRRRTTSAFSTRSPRWSSRRRHRVYERRRQQLG